MSRKISIPAQNLPFRRQASLGGSVSYRNVNGTDDYSYIVLARVTKVYYKLGRLDFTLVGENTNVVTDGGGDGQGSAPIPVDFFGYQANGKPYGHYRPVQIGDLITLAFLNGHRSSPIVLGVYPNNSQAYEVLSPSLYSTGDDRNSSVANTALSDQKVYPSGQIAYRSGKGDIFESLNGHSFLAISDHDSLPLDQIWATYNNISNFTFDGERQDPQKDKAGSWTLIHEDNPEADDSDNHITRFYVSDKGAFQIAQMSADYTGDSLVLNGSKDKGFTVTKYYQHPNKDAGDKSDNFKQPDFDKAQKYVTLKLGDKDNSFSVTTADKDESEEQSTSLVVNQNGIYVNGKPLTSSMAQKTGDTKSVISDDPAFKETLKEAQESAKKAAEEGKEAGLKATQAANEVSQDLSNMKDNMRYYMSISKDTDSHGDQPGYANMTDKQKGDLLGKFFDEAYVTKANAIKLVADDIKAGTLEAKDITVNDLDFNKGTGNHIQANIVDTGTLDAEKVNITNLNASNIHAGTLTANHINLGNLGDLSNYLGTIKAGSIDIGKVNKNGTVVENPIKTDTKNFVTDWLNTSKRNITDIDAKTITELNLDYWKTITNRQVNVSFSCTVTNYQGQFDINKLEDEEKALLHLPLGIEVKLTDDKNIVHIFQGVVDLGKLNLNGTSTINVTFKVDVPKNITASSAIAYGYIKADKIEIDNLKTTFADPKNDNLDSAFSVDSEGNVIARSLKAPGGEISGGNIYGGYIHGGHIMADSTIDGGTITGARIRATGSQTVSGLRYDTSYELTGDYLSWSAMPHTNNSGSYTEAGISNQSILGMTPGVYAYGDSANETPDTLSLLVSKGLLIGHLDHTQSDGTPMPDPYASYFYYDQNNGVKIGLGENTVKIGDKGSYENFYTNNSADFFRVDTTKAVSFHLNSVDASGQVGGDDIYGGEYQGKRFYKDTGFTIQIDGYVGFYAKSDDSKLTINNKLTVNDLDVKNGAKSALVSTTQGWQELYAYETANNYFGDIGESQTSENNIAIIGIDKIYNETVNTNLAYQVYVSSYGPGQVRVADRQPDKFIVKSDKPNTKFTWEIKALRKGFENHRLNNVPSSMPSSIDRQRLAGTLDEKYL